MATLARAPDIQRPRSAGTIIAATAQIFVASLALLLSPTPPPGQSAQPHRAPAPAFSNELRNFTRAPSPCLTGQDTFFAGPGRGPDYDWPNPVLRRSHLAALQSQPPAASFGLFPPPAKPFAQSDWPNPVLRAAARAESESGVWNNRLANLLASADQFFTSAGRGASYDWPNPVLRQSSAQAIAAQPPPPSLALFTPLPPPIAQNDWPNPVLRLAHHAALASQPLGWPSIDELGAVYAKPIFADYPNISGNSFRNVLAPLSHASLGQIRVTFVAASVAPLAVNHASIAVVGTATAPNTQSVPTELLFGGVSGFSIGAGQSITSDWTSFSCLSSDTLCAILDFASTAGIEIQYGFGVSGATLYYKQPAPNPVVSYNQSTVSGFSSSGGVNFVSLIETRSSSYAAPPPVPAYDWPNPVLRRSHAASLQAQPQPASLGLFPPPVKPFAQNDWPNPVRKVSQRAAEAAEGTVWNNRLADLLAGADQFFTSAGCAPAYDWPNPVLRRSHAAALAAQFDARGDLLLSTLKGQDKFFRDAGDAPDYDWPRPVLRIDRRPALVSQPLGYAVNIHLAIAPFAQTQWPNPVRRPPPLAVQNAQVLGGPFTLFLPHNRALIGVCASASVLTGSLTVGRSLSGTSASISALGARMDGTSLPINGASGAFFIG